MSSSTPFLVIERMTSLEEYFLALQEELPVRKSVETVVITICRALTLMAQAGASRISTGDWKLSNLGFRKEEPNRLRLLDFSGNRLDESLPAYACVRKGLGVFSAIYYLYWSAEKAPIDIRRSVFFFFFFANLQQFLGQTWWRKGKFATEESGVPTASNVVDLEKFLLNKTTTLGADQTPIVASTASFSELQPRPSQELSKDDLYEWLLSQNINPGEGTWISHLCSQEAAFTIPKAMKGRGLRERVRNWLMTLDEFEVYQDEKHEWSFKALHKEVKGPPRKRRRRTLQPGREKNAIDASGTQAAQSSPSEKEPAHGEGELEPPIQEKVVEESVEPPMVERGAEEEPTPENLDGWLFDARLDEARVDIHKTIEAMRTCDEYSAEMHELWQRLQSVEHAHFTMARMRA